VDNILYGGNVFMSRKLHHRSIFLSDIHLGTRGCQAEALLEFLNTHRADYLYLVGDIIDVWAMKNKAYWPSSHSEIIKEFIKIAKSGTKVVFIPGNHDEIFREMTLENLGNIAVEVDITKDIVHTTENGEKYLVVHGDRFDAVIQHTKWIAIFGARMYDLLLFSNRYFNNIRKFFGLKYWSLSKAAKNRAKAAVNYIFTFENTLAEYAATHTYTGVICGHIHQAENRRINHIHYLNCGDWVESCTAIVEDKHGRFRILNGLTHLYADE
jgi:UDP-2,3-diacylglucosamine pyrophosphatase LpxH